MIEQDPLSILPSAQGPPSSVFDDPINPPARLKYPTEGANDRLSLLHLSKRQIPTAPVFKPFFHDGMSADPEAPNREGYSCNRLRFVYPERFFSRSYRKPSILFVPLVAHPVIKGALFGKR